MSDPKIPRMLYVVLLALGALDFARMYPRLPERMASHFAADGTVNGWASKSELFPMMAVLLGVTFVATMVVPQLLSRLPASMINLPRKDYWLAPERRDETMRQLNAQTAWLGCVVLFVVLYATSLMMRANLPGGKFDNVGMVRVLVGMGIFAVVWTIVSVRHFLRVPENDARA